MNKKLNIGIITGGNVAERGISLKSGKTIFDHLDKKLIRTIDIGQNENFYTTTYLHPDNYYITMFSDKDGNFFPSSGDVASVSKVFEVTSDSQLSTEIDVDFLIP